MAQTLERLFRLRLLLIFLSLVAFIATLVIGATGTVSLQDAKVLNQTVSSTVPHNATVWSLAFAIFQNNFKIALRGFIPIYGIYFLLLVGWVTGLAFSADALLRSTPQNPVTGIYFLLVDMIFPFFFWELAGYALTMTEGIILVRGLIKGNRIERFFAPGHFRDSEIFKALLVLVMTAVVLLIAALMESYLIVLLR